MSVTLSESHQLLCKDSHIVKSSSAINCNSSTNDDTIEEKIWRKDPKSVLKKWKKETMIFRRSQNGIELFSQDDDSFTILAKSAVVEPKLYETGVNKKHKHLKIGFRVKFISVQNDDEIDGIYHDHDCHANKKRQDKISKWFEFRAVSIFSMVRWVVLLDPTINNPGIRENPLGYECKEQCCDATGPETWICKWDEIHPSMLDVQCLYMKKASIDKSAISKQKKRRSSRAYSRARALSVNETGSMYKISSNSHSNVSIQDNTPTTPESPEIHPPCYADVVNNSLGYIKQPFQDENSERFQEHSQPILDANISFNKIKESWIRRDEDDTFLPPYGPAKMIPLNMGIGEEIGLPPDIQKMWDPESKKVIYLDHNARRISLNSPESTRNKKSTNRNSLAVDPSPLQSIYSEGRRNSSRRGTSLSTFGSGSIGNCLDLSPGDDRWLPNFLETQLSAPAGIQIESTERKRNTNSFTQLPQIQETSDRIDHRIKILKPTKKMDTKRSQSWLNNADIMDVVTAEHMAQMAFNKPVSVLIDASGSNGREGEDGIHGHDGVHGMNGRSNMSDRNRGDPGHFGCDGGQGEDGDSGEDGSNAQDVEIYLSIFVSEEIDEEDEPKTYMKVTGSVDSLIELKSDRILFISCKGGQGGNGGKGGNGGNGGHGGDGGNGTQGLDGDGGAGGHGGDGGAAGSGGNGGRAGNGGNGGMVTIHSSDPRLFNLVECDVRGGTSGTPGIAGKPGIPGKGGKGGLGGKGAYFTTYRSRVTGMDKISQRNALIYNGGIHAQTSGWFMGDNEYNDRRDVISDRNKSGVTMAVTHIGRDGPMGINGKNGTESESGFIGDEGSWGSPGCVRWILNKYNSEIALQPELGQVFLFKYNAEVLSYEVFSNNDDGIMEPNESITITNVKITNTGQMPIPPGGVLTFPSTKTIRTYPNQNFILPEIDVGEIYICQTLFKACIHDVTVPNAPGPFISHVEIESQISLLGRDFIDARNVQTFDVQYPVALSLLEAPKQMGRGEEAALLIEITNYSLIPYGNKLNMPINLQIAVEVKVKLDRRIMIMGLRDSSIQLSPESQYSMPVTHLKFHPDQKDCIVMSVTEIPPRNGKIQICLNIYMENRSELFDNTLIQVELYLRGRLIEYGHFKIRVAPYYHALGEPGDALFITGPETTRASFLRWEYLLNSLGMMTIDFWDIERYKGLSFLQNSGSRHEVTWIDRYKGKMIIFPHYEPQQISGWDISCHFGLKIDDIIEKSAFPIEESTNNNNNDDGKFESFDDAEDEYFNERDSSLVLLTDSADQEIDKAILLGCLGLLKVDDKAAEYGGYHLFNPAGACYKMDVADKKLSKILSHFKKRFPDQVYIAYDRTIEYEMENGLYWKYGELVLRRLGIDRDSLLTLFCTGEQRMLDITCHPSVFDWVPVIGQWAQVYLVILSLLGTSHRSHLMSMNPSKPVLMLPWGEQLSVQYVAALSMHPYLTNELSPLMKSCWRLQYLAKDVEVHVSYYKSQVPILLYNIYDYFQTASSINLSGKIRNKMKELITSMEKSLLEYFGARSMKMWTKEARKMIQNGPPLRFCDLIDEKLLFNPTRIDTKSELIDLSKYLSSTEYTLIESVNCLSR